MRYMTPKAKPTSCKLNFAQLDRKNSKRYSCPAWLYLHSPLCRACRNHLLFTLVSLSTIKLCWNKNEKYSKTFLHQAPQSSSTNIIYAISMYTQMKRQPQPLPIPRIHVHFTQCFNLHLISLFN